MNTLTSRLVATTVALAGASLLAACASLGIARMPATNLDGVLVGFGNMSLYVFDKDVPGSGRSACDARCAGNWPPLFASTGATASGDWQLITRADGNPQWAYEGRPLYYRAKDQSAGDQTGDGIDGAWHLARP